MPYNILLVDDDKTFREEFAEALYDYKIYQAANGEEALKHLEHPNEIDVVLLDVKMPGLSGTQVLKKMKELNPNLGVIMLTGYGSKEVVIEALKGDADDYIEKPLDVEKTKSIIEKVLLDKGVKIDIRDADLQDKIQRVKQFAERNYDKKVSLEEAASIVCVSPKYLSRIFKEKTGLGFSKYKLEVKIEKAKEILEKTGYSIEQVSEKLGYENTASFIRIFKKLTGFTPHEYRTRKKAAFSQGRKPIPGKSRRI